MVSYKSVVKKIVNLKWGSLDEEDLQKLMILSAYSALEFAESLRITVKMNSKNKALKEMAEEELNTDNLSFEDYNVKGDHFKFLWHFINKYGLLKKFGSLEKVGETYMNHVRKLPKKVRVMSIVSREEELPNIFARILTTKNWKAEGLKAYRFYLKEHIALDSDEGGHADKLKNMKVGNEVADFYRIRLEMYKCISNLFF